MKKINKYIPFIRFDKYFTEYIVEAFGRLSYDQKNSIELIVVEIKIND